MWAQTSSNSVKWSWKHNSNKTHFSADNNNNNNNKLVLWTGLQENPDILKNHSFTHCRLMSPDCSFGTSSLLHCSHLTVSANSEDSWKRFCLSRTRLQRLVTLAFRHRIYILLLTSTYLLTHFLVNQDIPGQAIGICLFSVFCMLTETWPDPICADLWSISEDSPWPGCCHGSWGTTDHVSFYGDWWLLSRRQSRSAVSV